MDVFSNVFNVEKIFFAEGGGRVEVGDYSF